MWRAASHSLAAKERCGPWHSRYGEPSATEERFPAGSQHGCNLRKKEKVLGERRQELRAFIGGGRQET